MDITHLQGWHSIHVKLIFLYSQSAADKFKIFWGTFLVLPWLSYHASRQKKHQLLSYTSTFVVISLNSCCLFPNQGLRCEFNMMLTSICTGKSTHVLFQLESPFLNRKVWRKKTLNSALFAIIYSFDQKHMVWLSCVSRKLGCWSNVHANWLLTNCFGKIKPSFETLRSQTLK